MRELVGMPMLRGHESPASWLSRAALSQGVGVSELMAYLGMPARRDPDLAMTENLLWNVVDLTGHSMASFSFAVHMFSGLKSIDPDGEKLLLWSKTGKPRYRFCPLCLNEPGCKYFPLHWRFKAWHWCPTHDCLLSERCPHCRCEVHLPGSMINAGHKKEGVASLDRCLHCAGKLDEGWECIAHPLKERLAADWEIALLKNGCAVLAAIFHRKFSILGSDQKYSLDDFPRLREMGALPHDLLTFSNQTLLARRSLGKKPPRNHLGFLAQHSQPASVLEEVEEVLEKLRAMPEV